MYNIFLSKQWIFDRCLEGYHDRWAVFFMALIIAFFFSRIVSHKIYFYFKKFLRANFFYLIQLVVIGISTSILIPVITVILYFGGLLLCDDWLQFWPGVNAAHVIHAKLKLQFDQTHTLPLSEDALIKLDSGEYRKLLWNAKSKYIYSPQTHSYTWFVRPSRYFVVIFDSRRDYALYQLSPMVKSWNNIPLYPPAYPGPWDQLPN